MFRPLLIPIAVVGALLTATAAQASRPFTIALTSYTTVTQTHDTPPRGKPNKGDRIDFKDLLFTTTNNELGKKKNVPVGYDAGTVVYTSATSELIAGVTTFPGVGTLTFQGPMVTRKDGTVHVPVTRGTGSFKGAKGTLVIGVGNEKAPNTYLLTLPRIPCTGGCA